VKGVEIGAGFAAIEQKGSEHGDEMTPQGFVGNNNGGVLGGISTGQDITVSLALKPTSSIRLPRRHQLVKGGGIGRPAQGFAQGLVAEHLRELGKDLQVLLGGFLGHEKHKDQRHRTAVGCIEGHGLGDPNEGAERFLQSLDAPVGNRHALAKSGRAEPLAREEAVEHDASRKRMLVLEEQAHLLKEPFLARDLEVEHHIGGGEELRDERHGLEEKAGHHTLLS
jgi:hypothetical protein